MVKGTDIGDVQKIVVWHDNSGPGPAWHLQQVREGGEGVKWQNDKPVRSGGL